MSVRKRNRRTTKPLRKRCSIRATVECLSFSPLKSDPKAAGMTADQIAAAGISEMQPLFWCSECTNVWYETRHRFAKVIGKQDVPGGSFVPERPRDIYLG